MALTILRLPTGVPPVLPVFLWRKLCLPPFGAIPPPHRHFCSPSLFESERLRLRIKSDLLVLELRDSANKNLLSKQLAIELRDCLELCRKTTARSLILHSSVDNTFCFGADLKERRNMDEEEVRKFVCFLRTTFHILYQLPYPTIACLDGTALGGGLEMALACDFCVSGSESVLLGLPETSLAIIPGAGGTQLLTKKIGIQKALYLILTGLKFSAKVGLKYGILDIMYGANVAERFWPLEQSLGEEGAYEKLRQMMGTDDLSFLMGGVEENPQKKTHEFEDQEQIINAKKGLVIGYSLAKVISTNGPIAVRAAKEAVKTGGHTDTPTGLNIERIAYEKVLISKDRIRALESFEHKRKPVFHNS